MRMTPNTGGCTSVGVHLKYCFHWELQIGVRIKSCYIRIVPNKTRLSSCQDLNPLQSLNTKPLSFNTSEHFKLKNQGPEISSEKKIAVDTETFLAPFQKCRFFCIEGDGDAKVWPQLKRSRDLFLSGNDVNDDDDDDNNDDDDDDKSSLQCAF